MSLSATRMCSYTFLFAFSICCYQMVTAADSNINKHLRVVLFHLPPWVFVTRNSTGNVINASGIFFHVLEWLSKDLNFSYSYLEDNVRGAEDGPSTKGGMTYIVEKKADLILGSIAMTTERYKKIGFPYITNIGYFAIMIPTPKPSTNVAAVWQPFQLSVWMYVVVSILLTVTSVWLLERTVTNMEQTLSPSHFNAFTSLGKAFQYVTGVLLSQGVPLGSGTLYEKNLYIRYLAGAWCLASFVIVTAYCSILVSFVTSPNYKPIIESVYDLLNKPYLTVAVDKGWGPDVLFLEAERGIGKFLGDMLRKQPELRCEKTTECIERVRLGSSVYAMALVNIWGILGETLKKTGRCEFTIATERFWNVNVGFGIAKDNSKMEDFRRSLMKMREAGLFEVWLSQSMVADPRRCLRLPPHGRAKFKPPSLTLSGLSGAFVVLSAGVVLSILSFFAEKFH